MAALGGLLFALALPAAGIAVSGSGLRERADQLRQLNDVLSGDARATSIAISTLDASIAQARADLDRLRARAHVLARQRAEARNRLGIARHALDVSQQRLARRLRALYEQGEAEPLAVVLGAQSFDEALSGIEGLERMAIEDRSAVLLTRSTRRTVGALTRSLAAREAENERLRSTSASAAASLLAARSERARSLAAIEQRRNANHAQIGSLETQARALAVHSQPLVSGAAPAIVQGGRTLTVTATGYSLPGRTASGIPVGPGIVAVDPSVIPLGTRMTIPGYGEGVAADTGGAIGGARIDLWFSSQAEARAWGRRTVTITLHS